MKVSSSLLWILLFACFHNLTFSQDPCNNIIPIAEVNAAQTYTSGGSGVWISNFCQGTLFADGVEQIYSFVAPATGFYSIELLSSDGWVTYGWQSSSCDQYGWNCIQVGSTPGIYGMMEWTAGRTYYLLLDDENTTETIHQFQIIRSDAEACPDNYESNNTQGTATTSAFNTLGSSYINSVAYATIHDPFDEDFYRLFLSTEGTLNLNIPNTPAQYEMQLINGSGQLVDSWSWMDGGTPLSYTSVSNGYYYIRIYVDGRRPGVYSCEEYELNLEWIPSYLDVSPNSRSVSDAAGSTSFSVSASDEWDVSDDATWLYATEASATSINVNYDSNTSSSQRTANITVITNDGLTEIVTVVQAGGSDCEDAYEANDTQGTATTTAFSTLGNSNYNNSIYGTIHDDSDEDYFRLNLSVPGTLYLTLPNPPVDYDLELLNASGQQVAISGNSGSESLSFNNSVATSGYYYVRIYGYNGASSCTEYNLSVTWSPYYLDVSPDNRAVGSAAGSTTFEVSTEVDWDVSNDETWLSATKTNSTTIGVSYSENTTSSSRTAYISVQGGGIEETVTVTQQGIESLPNLTTFQPSGWDDQIVISNEQGTRNDSEIEAGQISYIDFAWKNTGSVTAGAHVCGLYIDEQQIKWLENPGLSSGYFSSEDDVEYTFTESGWYTLKLVIDIDDNVIESTDTDNEYQRQIFIKPSTTGMDEYNVSDNLTVFPNPTNGKFYLEIQNAKFDTYLVEIIDPTGKVIWENQIENQGSVLKESIDISRNPAGIYFIKVHYNSVSRVRKIVLTL